MINAGNYKTKIKIINIEEQIDAEGFKIENKEITILEPYARIKTTKGFTLIQNDTDFSKSYTNFTIRFPKKEITREMFIKYKNKIYTIEYLNNIDEMGIELEIQAKEVTK